MKFVLLVSTALASSIYAEDGVRGRPESVGGGRPSFGGGQRPSSGAGGQRPSASDAAEGGFFFGGVGREGQGRGGMGGPKRRPQILNEYLKEWSKDVVTTDALDCDTSSANANAPACHRDNRGTAGAWVCRTLYNPITGDSESSTLCGAIDFNLDGPDACGCCPDENGAMTCPTEASCDLTCTTRNGAEGFYIMFGGANDDDTAETTTQDDSMSLMKRKRIRCLAKEFATTVLAKEGAQCATEAPDMVETMDDAP